MNSTSQRAFADENPHPNVGTIGGASGAGKWKQAGHTALSRAGPSPHRDSWNVLLGRPAGGRRIDADRLCQRQRPGLARRRTFLEQELIQLRKAGAPLIDIGQTGDEGDEFVDLFPSAHDVEAVFNFTKRDVQYTQILPNCESRG